MRIKDLATRTAKMITGNAYFGVDNGANEVRKIDYKELAKQIIEEYNLSTLAGSAQSVQGALNALNSNLTSITGWKNSGSFNDLKKSGLYMVSQLTDGPDVSGISTWAVLVMSSGATGVDGTTVKQMAFVQNGNSIFTRQLIAGTWSAWTPQPTRAEVDALNNSIGTLSGIKTVVVNDTTNESGIITLNVGTFTGRPYVISNISSNLQTPYRITCDGFGASAGTVNLRVRKSSDNTAITNTTIQDTVLIIFSR